MDMYPSALVTGREYVEYLKTIIKGQDESSVLDFEMDLYKAYEL